VKKTISTDKAPAAIGPYSQAVWAGDLLFCSGQLGIDPTKGTLAGPGIQAQAEQSLANIEAILASQGLDASDVVKTLVFLTDMGDFKTFNEIYGKTFKENPPARSCVAVPALPLCGVVEIEVTAQKR
jgi:2-iminobutanoate/2-iminopropanoate deaminase